MSPTAQAEKRLSATSGTALLHLADRSCPSETTPKVVGAGFSSVNENRRKETFILLISIRYPNLYTNTASQSGGTEPTLLETKELKSLELKSVPNDLDTQLRRHSYRHGGTQEKFLILTDYEHQHTDTTGATRFLPRKEASKANILDGFKQAASKGGFVVIYYSGHTECSGYGTSTATRKDGFLLYEEHGVDGKGPPYLISGDYKRIYGREVHDALSKREDPRRDITITLVFDTCHVAPFFEGVIRFPCIYQAKAIGGSTEYPQEREASEYQEQVIFVAATQFHEVAGTFGGRYSDKQNGAVTRVMTEFLGEYRASRSVQDLVDELYSVCKPRQTPQILALRPIRGDFKLNP